MTSWARVALCSVLIVVSGTSTSSAWGDDRSGHAGALLPPEVAPRTGSNESTTGRIETLASNQLVFGTSQSRFRAGTDNQGWWSLETRANDSMDNYIVGRCCGELHRNFFTFDLSSLEERVLAATLKLRRYWDRGDPRETLGLFDVVTPAQQLNENADPDPVIYEDLGTGKSYGIFKVSTEGTYKDQVFSFPLNSAAVTDINAARGRFFSIGGDLLSVSGEHRQSLFASSDGAGPQRLVVTTCSIEGTRHADTLIGTPGRDIICAKGGPDNIVAKGGNDLILAGGDGDAIDGGMGDDRIEGGKGPDVIVGRRGSDRLLGQEGRDVLRSGKGTDRIRGGGEGDFLQAGPRRDNLYGEGSNDVLRGSRGSDLLHGGGGSDDCRGGPGDDDIRSCEDDRVAIHGLREWANLRLRLLKNALLGG